MQITSSKSATVLAGIIQLQTQNLAINISKEERQVSLSYIPPSRLIIEPVLNKI